MKSLNLFKILFEEEVGTNSESNEDIIANIVLGKAVSTDPEEIEANKPIRTELLKALQTPLPEPDQEEIPFFGLEKLNEAKRLTPEEREKREKEAAAKKAARSLIEQESKRKKDFLTQVLTQMPAYEAMDGTAKFFRIKPLESLKIDLVSGKITKEQFKNTLKVQKEKVLNNSTSQFTNFSYNEIPPNETGSGSGSFFTYVLTADIDGLTTTIKVVIAAGGNAGNDFELKAYEEINKRVGPVWENLMCFLVDKGKIHTINDFGKVDRNTARVLRPFAGEMQNVGAIISDITINRIGSNPIYISLKNEKGTTFANTGYGGAFMLKPPAETGTGLYQIGVASSGEGTSEGRKQIDKFLELLNVNKNLMAEGFEAYANSLALRNGLLDPSIKSVPTLRQMTQIIEKDKGDAAVRYLSYQLGYGYIYFRKLGDGYRIIDLQVNDITEATNKAVEIFGEFKSGFIRYPYFVKPSKQKSSRQLTISIKTSTAHYMLEIRNAQSGVSTPNDVIASLECKVKVTKTFAKTYKCNINWRQKLLDIEEDRMRLVQHNIDESFLLSNLLFRNKRNKF